LPTGVIVTTHVQSLVGVSITTGVGVSVGAIHDVPTPIGVPSSPSHLKLLGVGVLVATGIGVPSPPQCQSLVGEGVSVGSGISVHEGVPIMGVSGTHVTCTSVGVAVAVAVGAGVSVAVGAGPFRMAGIYTCGFGWAAGRVWALLWLTKRTDRTVNMNTIISTTRDFFTRVLLCSISYLILIKLIRLSCVMSSQVWRV
jgi:hypothetical protein